MDIKKLKELADETFYSISIPTLVPSTKSIKLDNGNLYSIRDQIEIAIDENNSSSISDEVEIYYIPEDYGISDGGMFFNIDIIRTLTTDEIDKKAEMQFKDRLWKKVYNYLTTNGYKRKSYSSKDYKEWKDISLIDLYKANNFEKLRSYYMRFFEKEKK